MYKQSKLEQETAEYGCHITPENQNEIQAIPQSCQEIQTDLDDLSSDSSSDDVSDPNPDNHTNQHVSE